MVVSVLYLDYFSHLKKRTAWTQRRRSGAKNKNKPKTSIYHDPWLGGGQNGTSNNNPHNYKLHTGIYVSNTIVFLSPQETNGVDPGDGSVSAGLVQAVGGLVAHLAENMTMHPTSCWMLGDLLEE